MLVEVTYNTCKMSEYLLQKKTKLYTRKQFKYSIIV